PAVLEDGGAEQPDDVKLVGHELGVGECELGEALVGLGHVEHDGSNVFWFGEVGQRRGQSMGGLSIGNLDKAVALALGRHNYGDEIHLAVLVAFEAVLVETNGSRKDSAPLLLGFA